MHQRHEIMATGTIRRNAGEYFKKDYTISGATIDSKAQLYTYTAGKTGWRCISAWMELDSSVTGANAVIILSNPIYVKSSNQWTARIYNPNNVSITITGTVIFAFARDESFYS